MAEASIYKFPEEATGWVFIGHELAAEVEGKTKRKTEEKGYVVRCDL